MRQNAKFNTSLLPFSVIFLEIKNTSETNVCREMVVDSEQIDIICLFSSGPYDFPNVHVDLCCANDDDLWNDHVLCSFAAAVVAVVVVNANDSLTVLHDVVNTDIC